jgi:hypothetical protein
MVSRPNPAGISSAVVSKLERRTITSGSIVPRLESCFQRWLLLYCRSAPNRRAATLDRSFSNAFCMRLGAQVGLAVLLFNRGRSMLRLSNNIVAGGEDMGYFDC